MLDQEDLKRVETFVAPTKLACVPWEQVIRNSVDRYVEMSKGNIPSGVFTGFQNFDTETGGLKVGSLNILVAETGGCKSTVAANIVNHVCIQNRKPVACFSYEMMQDEFADMFFSMNAKVNRNHFNTGRFLDHDLKNMAEKTQNLASAPLFIFDSPSTVEDLEEACSQLNAGTHLELVVVDYIQLVTPTNGRDMREQQIAQVSRALKRLAAKLKCPILALSQLNEDGKVRESRSIAHDANLILHIKRDEEILNLEVAKGRRIAKATYSLNFDVQFCSVT